MAQSTLSKVMRCAIQDVNRRFISVAGLMNGHQQRAFAYKAAAAVAASANQKTLLWNDVSHKHRSFATETSSNTKFCNA